MQSDIIRQSAPVIVSTIIVTGYFVIIYQLFLAKSDFPANVFQLMNMLFGGMTVAFATVVNYWMGSSAGSKEKDATLKQVALNNNPPVPPTPTLPTP